MTIVKVIIIRHPAALVYDTEWYTEIITIPQTTESFCVSENRARRREAKLRKRNQHAMVLRKLWGIRGGSCMAVVSDCNEVWCAGD